MRRSIQALAVAALVVVVCAVAGAVVPRSSQAPRPKGPPAHRILILANAIHTDIAVPIDAEALARFAPLVNAGIRADLAGARYLIFGWGGREFYLQTPTWSDLKPLPLWKGLTLDNSVIHVDVAGPIDESQALVSGIDLDAKGFDDLLTFIDASFTRRDGAVVAIDGFGYGEMDRFFEAEGSFTAIAGCNTWTAAALRSAGLRTGLWNPLPISLAWSLKLLN